MQPCVKAESLRFVEIWLINEVCQLKFEMGVKFTGRQKHPGNRIQRVTYILNFP